VNRALLCLAAAASTALAETPKKDARFFDSRVAPILARRCAGCHNQELKNGDLSVLDRESLLKGGRRGPAIVPGKPRESLFILSLSHQGDIKMPPGPRLPRKEIAILTEWVARGAPWGAKPASKD
jgi:hypothetical protein